MKKKKSKEEKHLKGTENTITTETCDSRDQNTLKRHATKAQKRMLHKQNQKNMHKVLVTTTISPKKEHQDASSLQESDKKTKHQNATSRQQQSPSHAKKLN